MIICQTPLRVSFFGGGTDFPEFFREHGGAVLSTAIDKYIYHSITPFPSEFFDYSIRLAYRRVECVSAVSRIKHAPFREALRHFGINKDIEIGLTADLPAFSGLGSSSSFVVGLLNGLAAHQGQFIPDRELARAAIRLERGVLREAVGLQDQVAAAFGGTNLVEFSGEDDFVVHRVSVSRERLAELGRSLMLFFTRITRRAGVLEARKMRNLAATSKGLGNILRQVEKGHALLTGNAPLSGFGRLLDQAWREKRGLDPEVSNPAIDGMYSRAMAAGASGGKLLGAGGGGFMLLFAPPERQEKVRSALRGHPEVRFAINAPGSHIIHS